MIMKNEGLEGWGGSWYKLQGPSGLEGGQGPDYVAYGLIQKVPQNATFLNLLFLKIVAF